MATFQSMMVRFAGSVLVAMLCLVIASCGGDPLPQSQPQSGPQSEPESASATSESGANDESDGEEATEFESEAGGEVVGSDEPSGEATDGAIVIDAAAEGTPIDRRLLGVNLPAWIRPSILEDPLFQQGALESGTTLVRMPGGSWSNVYDWLGCELGDPERCFWTWASRPSDFANFLTSTDLEGMWTASINDTAQKSAAVVAFFNGEVGDTTAIGIDRDGVDWGVVGDWAELRATNGNPDPIGILLWEVGNEVYGGRPSDGGAQCAPFGWEEVWTCDGTEYAVGIDDHDGALAIREAMLAVDPSIEVGLVGVSDPSSWSDWGNEVFDASGDSLDMYVVHHYGFDQSPSPAAALAEAGQSWPQVIADSRRGLPESATLAITEYNLVSFEAGDTSQTMTQAMNAFFLADTIGELARAEVEIATWWNLANGVTGSGTDYGLISVENGDGFRRAPAFEAFAMWGRTGTSLLDVPARTDDLRVYPTRHDDGRLAIVVINLGVEQQTTDVVVEGVIGAASWDVSIESASTDDLTSRQLTLTPAERLGSAEMPISLTLAPWSMNLIEVRPAG